MMTTRNRAIALFVLSAYIAFVFVQSLFFKFTGSVESIFIFSTLRDWSGIGLFEPFGRFFIGASELVASILLFIPRTRIFGAGMALGIISGAIVFHLFTPLGVEIMGDGGLLFTLACGVWIASAVILWLERAKVASLLAFVSGQQQPMRT
jgi:uncharacterized membrane protein YphA (DoxX/SURF4 family)